MAHTADYGQVQYRPMILQYSDILQYLFLICLWNTDSSDLQSMLGLCCNETYGAMTNYDNRDDDGDNYGNKDVNDDDNAAFGSGSDGPIVNPIMTPRSCGGGSGDNGDGSAATAHYLSTHRTIYLPFKGHIKDVP